MFYSTSIFESSGLDGLKALYATIGMGGINVLMTLISVVMVEKAGRRTLLLIGFGGMAVVTLLLTVFMLLYVRVHEIASMMSAVDLELALMYMEMWFQKSYSRAAYDIQKRLLLFFALVVKTSKVWRFFVSFTFFDA